MTRMTRMREGELFESHEIRGPNKLAEPRLAPPATRRIIEASSIPSAARQEILLGRLHVECIPDGVLFPGRLHEVG